MPGQPSDRFCGNCRFGIDEDDNLGDEDELYCQRNPVIPNGDPGTLGTFPITHTYWWCGEWQPTDPQTVPEGAATLARLVLLGDLTAARALADKLKES